MVNSRKANFLRFWFPPLLYSGIIFYISSIPHVKTPLAEIQFDKILHMAEYIPFGFLTARLIYHIRAAISGRRLGVWVFIISLVCAVSDEWHQSFVPGRNVGGIDVLWDIIGAVTGGYIFFRHVIKHKK